MLGNKDALATIAVRSMDVARKFYEGKLGLKLLESGQPGVSNYLSGKAGMVVYVSQ